MTLTVEGMYDACEASIGATTAEVRGRILCCRFAAKGEDYTGTLGKASWSSLFVAEAAEPCGMAPTTAVICPGRTLPSLLVHLPQDYSLAACYCPEVNGCTVTGDLGQQTDVMVVFVIKLCALFQLQDVMVDTTFNLMVHERSGAFWRAHTQNDAWGLPRKQKPACLGHSQCVPHTA